MDSRRGARPGDRGRGAVDGSARGDGAAADPLWRGPVVPPPRAAGWRGWVGHSLSAGWLTGLCAVSGRHGNPDTIARRASGAVRRMFVISPSWEGDLS